ncbi:hypothetical protein PTMSG1_00482 [Pyrenophora teres f. maculata]|nr:hypothetical protein PTMSG1_00482 [Pyrenophora teres f. maculata]
MQLAKLARLHFSGLTTQLNWPTLIWNSNSSGKFVWLWILVQGSFWNWTYLGFYEDYYFEEGTRMVYDQVGRPVWTFRSEKIGDKNADCFYHPYGSIFLPWRDIAIRLAYYHVIDNTIHVLWFRYFNTDAPYKTHLNNLEILTMVLFTTLVIYIYARMRTHVYFSDDDDERGLLIDIKSPIPSPIHSASRDLFTFSSLQYGFRTASELRYTCMTTSFVLACATATWPVLEFPHLWAGVAEFALILWTKSNEHVRAGKGV